MAGRDNQNADGLLPEQALIEASDWQLRLTEEPDNLELRERLDLWRKMNPDHERAWALLGRSIELTRRTEPIYTGDWQHAPAVQDSLPGLPVRRSMIRQGVSLKARHHALAAVAASVLAIVAAPDMLLHLRADYANGTAQTRDIDLADGSTVTLGADSAITERFSQNARDIVLLKGEAWFDVTTDPDRPFRVIASDMTVTVTGTAFDVSMTAQTLSIGVARGSVRVERDGHPPVEMALKPGQHFSMDRSSGRRARSEVDPSELGAWRSGRLAVRNAAMADVIELLDRNYKGAILLRGDKPRATRVTGVYDLNDPAGSAQILAAAHNLRIRHFTPWLIIVSGD